jgi:hypothetical protein
VIAWCACLFIATLQQPLQPAPKSSPPKSAAKSAPLAPPQLQPTQPQLQLPPAPRPEPKAPVAPWEGTLRAGQAKLQELSLAQKYDDALALGERVLAMPTWEQEPERDRAEVLYALGIARGTAEKVDAAAEVFHRASGLAGSDALGLDSIYGAGTFRLIKAEDLRKNIPEIREKLGLQPLPPSQPPMPLGAAPGGPPGPGSAVPTAPPQEPDALGIAREAYLAARKDLVERLRCDTSDRDTRGNLELTQRRLRELDELEKKRQEDEQKQKDQQKPGDDKKQDKQKQDPSKQDKQDQQKQDQQQDDKQKPQDQPKPDDQQKQDDAKKPDEPKPDPKDAQPKEEKPKDAQPDPKSAQKEQFLSSEEVMRLLDQLKQIEQQAEQVRAALRERHRVPVKKDW